MSASFELRSCARVKSDVPLWESPSVLLAWHQERDILKVLCQLECNIIHSGTECRQFLESQEKQYTVSLSQMTEATIEAICVDIIWPHLIFPK